MTMTRRNCKGCNHSNRLKCGTCNIKRCRCSCNTCKKTRRVRKTRRMRKMRGG